MLLRLVIVAACLALLGWTVARLGPRQVLRVAGDADPLWLGLSFLPVLGRFLIWGHKWARILRRKAKVPYWTALRILIAGSFINLTTPTAKLGGGVLRAAFLHRRFGWGLAESYGRAFVDQATNALGTFLLYALLALAVFVSAPDLVGRHGFLASGVLLLALLATGLALRGWAWSRLQTPTVRRVLVRLTPRRFRQDDHEGADADWIRPVFYPFLGERSAWTTLLPDIAWAAVSFASLCVANAMVFRALGMETNLWLMSAAVVMGYFAGVASGAWGGIGVTEAALTGLYIRFGIPADVATAGALLHRATFYLVILGFGGLSLLYEGRFRESR
jgi:uncharacterized membrane protein YbhN (UPF0104 family)